jgi:hypothetical protein
MNRTRSRLTRMQWIVIAPLMCSFLLPACSSGSAADGDASAPEGEPGADAGAAVSDGFQAEVTSAVSVALTWSPVAGAVRYEIEGSVGDQEFFPVATLGSETESFEVFPVVDDTPMSFRLTAVAADGAGSSRTVSVTMPAEVPNPLTVNVVLEQSEGAFPPGFDPASLDPSTFDFSSLDLSSMDSEDFDPSSLLSGPATVTQEIGPEGGRIEATASNGTTYVLTMPEGALPSAIQLSMTPVASLDGLPDETEFLGAVQIEPEGIPLGVPAILTIDWPTPIPETEGQMIVGIGFGSAGEEFYFLPYDAGEGVSSAGGVKLARPVGAGAGGATMFTTQSQGVAKASPTAVVRNRREHPAADRRRRAAQTSAAAKAQSKMRADDDLAPLVPISEETWILRNNLEFIRRSALDPRDVTGLIWEIEHIGELLRDSGDQVPQSLKEEVWNALLDAIRDRLKLGAEADCEEDDLMEGVKLAERVMDFGAVNSPGRPSSAFDRELVRRFVKKYGVERDRLVEKIRDLVERCPRAFHVDGNLGDNKFDQDVCDYRFWFTLTGTNSEGSWEHLMIPNNASFQWGTYTFSGGLRSGGWASGAGEYEINYDEDGKPVSMTFTNSGCVKMEKGGSCNKEVGSLNLTPLPNGCGK